MAGEHPPAPPRRSFALTGPSVALDPSTHAVRGDLADVRLADRVFAPHYAEAMAAAVRKDAVLRDAKTGGGTIARLVPGDAFEVLELAGGDAWGIAVASGLVGYVDRSVLDVA